VSEALLLDDETIRNYVCRYKTGGISNLLETYHKGSEPKLSNEQLSQLCEELDNKIYQNTKEICAYIKTTFQQTYTVSGTTDLLHRLNYVYKKPKLVPANADIEKQELFLKEYEKFMANKPENVAVFFMDAVHPVHNSVANYGWIKKGVEKELKSNTGRERLNIHGAMNAETYETTIVVGEENVNTDSTINLLEYLEKLYPLAAAIYVILDNASYHFSKPVSDWIKNSKIKLVFLPAFSPELNLIERLWKIFKKKVLYNKYYEKFSDFKEACFGFFENQEDYYDEISSTMGNGLEALA
jgi:transposase